MIRNLVLTLVLPAVFLGGLSAQSLIKWDQWKLVNPTYVTKGLVITAKNITLFPYCTTKPRSSCGDVGILQKVTIPTTGLYQLTIAGYAGGTGAFQATIRVMQNSWKSDWQDNNYGYLHIRKTHYLRKGEATILFLTNTSDLWGDQWNLVQPTLEPVIEPVVDINLYSGSSHNRLSVTSSKANLVAVSLTPLSSPIQIPGMGYGLYLDPRNMVILWTSVFPGVKLNLQKAAEKVSWGPGSTRFYFQAASFRTFGSRSWL